MKIRAKGSSPYAFDAHPDAARELIASGNYEAVSDKESQSAEGSASPSEKAVGSSAAAPPKRRTKKAK